jgi:hypothetical protein
MIVAIKKATGTELKFICCISPAVSIPETQADPATFVPK